MSHRFAEPLRGYRFHPETWTDSQSQEWCEQWYKEASFDKQSLKNPATNRKIRRGKARWNNIHRYCNTRVRKRFPGLFGEFKVEDPTPIVLPHTTDLKNKIRDIVGLWDNDSPTLDKINGYCVGHDFKHDGECPYLFADLQSSKDIECLPPDETKQAGEKKVAAKKILNSIATDFITLYFFGTVETRLQFINLVVTMFDFFLSELRSLDPATFPKENIILMFKGGVTLRLIIRDLLKDFGGDLEQVVFYKLHKYIKISDYDFEMLSREHLFDMDKNTITKFNLLTYLVILALRNYLIQHKAIFFNFFRLRSSEQQKKVKELKVHLQKAIKDITTKDPSNFYSNVIIEHLQYEGKCEDPASGQFDTPLSKEEQHRLSQFRPIEGKDTSPCRTDFALVVNANKPTDESPGCFITAKNLLKHYGISQSTILKLPLQSRNKGSRFYATHNPQIYGAVGSNTIMFNLNRIKYDFTLYYRKNGELFRESVVGEILDLSHADSADRRKNPGNVIPSDKVRLYKFFGYNLEFHSYSLQGFFHDLNSILFSETDWQPWTEVKYLKRIYRLIYVCVLHFFSVDLETNLTFLERLGYMDDFINALHMNESPKFLCRKCISGSLLEKFGEEMDRVMEKAARSSARPPKADNTSPYIEFLNSTVNILTEIRDALWAEYQLSRDPRFSVGSLHPSDLAVEFPAAYW